MNDVYSDMSVLDLQGLDVASAERLPGDLGGDSGVSLLLCN
jgi:hypothetical protein